MCYFFSNSCSMAPRKGQKQQGGEQNISLGPQVHKLISFRGVYCLVLFAFLIRPDTGLRNAVVCCKSPMILEINLKVSVFYNSSIELQSIFK